MILCIFDLFVSDKKNGNPAARHAANPAGLSKLPVILKPAAAGKMPAHCPIPYRACAQHKHTMMVPIYFISSSDIALNKKYSRVNDAMAKMVIAGTPVRHIRTNK